MTASKPDLRVNNKERLFHERVAQHAKDNPDKKEYWIHTESMAEGFILSMAAPLHLMSKEVEGSYRLELKAAANRYRRACTQGQALALLRELAEDHTPIEYCGMRLRVPSAADCAKWPTGVPFNPLKGLYDDSI